MGSTKKKILKMKTTFLALFALTYASEMPEGMEGMATAMCNQMNYGLLSVDNPTDYPALSADMGEISQDGKDCKMTVEGGSVSYKDCDCSDAETYNFADEAACDFLKEAPMGPDQNEEAVEKIISLTCGSDPSECIDAQKDLEAEENFIQKGLLRATCEAACAEFPNETCGFVVNGVSMILFAMLAMLKY